MPWTFTPLYKKKPELKDGVLIEGLPGIGNVGKVAVDFIGEEVNAIPLYDIFSYTFPHSVFVNEKNLVELPRVQMSYSKNFVFLTGDVQPIDEVSSYEFTEAILNVCEDLGITSIITLGGIGLQAIPKKPKVYITGNSKKAATESKNYEPAYTSEISSGAFSMTGALHQSGEPSNLTSACSQVSGVTCYLDAGKTYRFDSLKLSKGAKIEIKPVKGQVNLQTKIYVDGNIEISDSSVVTPENRAPNLLLMASGAKVSLTPSSALYAGIYAPNAKIETKGSATVYGALIGDKYDLNGSTTIHFDEALKNEQASSGSASGSQVLAWRDGATSAWGVGPAATSSSDTTKTGGDEETTPTVLLSR